MAHARHRLRRNPPRRRNRAHEGRLPENPRAVPRSLRAAVLPVRHHADRQPAVSIPGVRSRRISSGCKRTTRQAIARWRWRARISPRNSTACATTQTGPRSGCARRRNGRFRRSIANARPRRDCRRNSTRWRRAPKSAMRNIAATSPRCRCNWATRCIDAGCFRGSSTERAPPMPRTGTNSTRCGVKWRRLRRLAGRRHVRRRRRLRRRPSGSGARHSRGPVRRANDGGPTDPIRRSDGEACFAVVG